MQFLVKRDRKKRFRFASIQSKTGQNRLRRFSLPSDHLDTMVLIYADRYYTRSTAVLHIAKELGGAWQCLYFFMVIPRPFRDAVYNWVARNRYGWFGKQDLCMAPEKDIEDRFLD